MFSWPQAFPLLPGESVEWKLVAAGGSSSTIGGRWWILDEAALERLAEVEKIVAQVEDDEMRSLARMMAFAELNLYDEAVALLDALATLAPPSGRAALLHRTGAILFGEMLAKMPGEIHKKTKRWVWMRLQECLAGLEECLPGWKGKDMRIPSIYPVASLKGCSKSV